MPTTQEKFINDLAIKLRVLKPAEKNRYIYHLDQFAQDCQTFDPRQRKTSAFFPHRLACSMYLSLEGIPFTQPEFASQVTHQDIQTSEKFNALCAGIIAYSKASEEQRNNFKTSIMKAANPLSKMIYLFKMHKNGLD